MCVLLSAFRGNRGVIEIRIGIMTQLSCMIKKDKTKKRRRNNKHTLYAINTCIQNTVTLQAFRCTQRNVTHTRGDAGSVLWFTFLCRNDCLPTSCIQLYQPELSLSDSISCLQPTSCSLYLTRRLFHPIYTGHSN